MAPKAAFEDLQCLFQRCRALGRLGCTFLYRTCACQIGKVAICNIWAQANSLSLNGDNFKPTHPPLDGLPMEVWGGSGRGGSYSRLGLAVV